MAARRRLGDSVRIASPSSRYMRRTRLWFTTQPSRRSSTPLRRAPYRTRLHAISLMRLRSTGSSRSIEVSCSILRLMSKIWNARRSLTCQTLRICGRTALRRTRLTTFFHDVLQDLTIKSQIRNEALEPRVLLAQLAQFVDLRRSKRSEASFPRVERRRRDAELADDLGDGRAGFGLP